MEERTTNGQNGLAYHDSDFLFDSLVCESESALSLIPIDVGASSSDENHQNDKSQSFKNLSIPGPFDTHLQHGQEERWNSFFSVHERGKFFQPKSYIFYEFQKYFQIPNLKTVFEVGCGHGSTLIPLASHLPSTVHYVATDYSETALGILKGHDLFTACSNGSSDILERISIELWDVTKPMQCEKYLGFADIILCVFSLSAVHPSSHIQALTNISLISNPGSFVLIRDYGIYDMTMFRHKRRFDTYLFQREDGTLCYYFTIEYIATLASQTGFRVIELKYACVLNKNRKNGKEMKRVFLHAVLQKI